jgi:hypothetical protein
MRKRIGLLNITLVLALYLPARAAEPSVDISTSFNKITDDKAMTCFKHHPNGTFTADLKDEPKSRAELEITKSFEWTISDNANVFFGSVNAQTVELKLLNMETLFKSYLVKVVVTWTLFDKAANTTSYKTASDSMTLDVKTFSVGLEAVPAGNNPELASGRICRNAQLDYRKAKWKVTVLPEETTATVTPVSDNVTITGGGGIINNDAVWVNGVVVGEYKIKVTHDDCDLCTSTNGENVFVFKFANTVSSSDGPKDGTVDGYKVSVPSGGNNVECPARVSQNFTMKVLTYPMVDLYTGTVSGQAKISYEAEAFSKIIKRIEVDPSPVSISITYEFLTLNLQSSGTGDIAAFVGGVAIKLNNEPVIPGKTLTYSSTQIDVPFGFSSYPGTCLGGLSGVSTDAKRNYTVGVEAYTLQTQLAGSAKTTNNQMTYVDNSSYVKGTTPVTLGEEDNVFEIK